MPPEDTYPVTTTLEEYFLQYQNTAIDFALRVTWKDGQPQFYIRPWNTNGDTLDYRVSGNTVECITRKFKQPEEP